MSAVTTALAAAVARQATDSCTSELAFAEHRSAAKAAGGLLCQYLGNRQIRHGIVTHGGAAPSIVPVHPSALYYPRAPDAESLQQLGTRVRDCFEAGGLATGCAHEVPQASPVDTDLVPDPWRRHRTSATAAGGAV